MQGLNTVEPRNNPYIQGCRGSTSLGPGNSTSGTLNVLLEAFPWLSLKFRYAIIAKESLGDRLMVGRETLDLVVRVRILLPQPIKYRMRGALV
jgi:hypothetical protein